MEADLPGVETETRASEPLLAAVTVTYNPNLDILGLQLQQLPPDCVKVWVDNGSAAGLVERLFAIASTRTDLLLISNLDNVGLAAALNQGCEESKIWRSGVTHLLLLDQDTEPGEGGVESLFDAYERLAREHPRLGCVGPRLQDVQTGLEHGFHQMSGCRWVRRYAVPDFAIPVENLNGSGTLLSYDLFHSLGGLDSDFFIDHVDTAWSFRVLDAGYELFGIPSVHFQHRMGERSLRFWLLGWRIWPYRAPRRHRFLFRNTVKLLRRRGVPICWKLWAPVKLAVTMLVHLAVDEARAEQMKQMWGGLRDGFASPELQV